MAKKDTRLFIRLDLDYPDHPKIIGLSDAAFRAHITMMAYARKHKTDGRIPQQIAQRFVDEALNELRTNDPDTPSLELQPDGSYYLHGYEDMNETRAEIDARSRANAENGRRSAAARKRTVQRKGNESLNQSFNEIATETETEIEIEEEHLSSDTDVSDGGDQASPEIIDLCEHLASRVRANGNKVGTVGKRWHQAMDKLSRIDGYTPDQITQVIDWSQQDQFWSSNILSASKLREKFDTLKGRMFAERNSGANLSGSQRRLHQAAEAAHRMNEVLDPDPVHTDPFAAEAATRQQEIAQ